MEPIQTPQRRKGGRPLSFDRSEALKKAMMLFWQHGYESTSIGDLTEALNVTPPSIYTAFGDKKRLFREAIQLYMSGPVTSKCIIDEAPSAREAAWGLLQAAAVGFTGDDTPPGCLLASSAISCSASATDVQQELAIIRQTIESHLRNRIIRAIGSGEISPPAPVDADALAGLVMAVIQGMSTLARDGASREKLITIARTAMTAWPV